MINHVMDEGQVENRPSGPLRVKASKTCKSTSFRGVIPVKYRPRHQVGYLARTRFEEDMKIHEYGISHGVSPKTNDTRPLAACARVYLSQDMNAANFTNAPASFGSHQPKIYHPAFLAKPANLLGYGQDDGLFGTRL